MSSLQVHTGRWTDWSKGSVLGDQYTMSAASGNVLIAFIAIFVTLVGGVAWSVIAYITHQFRVSPRAEDGLHYQTQALLRNIHSPSIFAWDVLRSVIAWRKRTSWGALAAAFSLALLAIVTYVVFAAAGLLLTYIASTGDVLLRSTTCGALDLRGLENQSVPDQYAVYLALQAQASELVTQGYDYAQVCYPGTDLNGSQALITSAPASDCSFYVQPFINWTTSFPGVCPFNEGICKGSTTDIVRFDTGKIDTHDHLGRNSPVSARLQFRRVTTCAPLVTDGFYSNGFYNDSSLGDVAVWNYGVNLGQQILTPQSLNPNETFVYSRASYEAADLPYLLLAASSIEFGDSNNQTYVPAFYPDPRLAPPESAVTLLFLANRAFYPEPVNDLWFNATALFPESNPLSDGADWYYSKELASILGCIDEIELCNPVNSKCVEWKDWVQYSAQSDDAPATGSLLETLQPLDLNTNQLWAALDISKILYDSGVWNIVQDMGGNALAASEYLYGAGNIASTLGLPPHQWIAELQRLQAASLAIVQRSVFTEAAGYTYPALVGLVKANNNTDDWTCNIQKFRNEAYTSFSVLGLGLIFGLGGLIIALGGLITLIMPAVQRRSGKGEFRRLQWYLNGVLRLQRIAFEDRGLGRWEGSFEDDNNDVPVTVQDDKFVPFTTAVPAVPSQLAPIGGDGHGAGMTDAKKRQPISQSVSNSETSDEVSPVASSREVGERLYRDTSHHGHRL